MAFTNSHASCAPAQQSGSCLCVCSYRDVQPQGHNSPEKEPLELPPIIWERIAEELPYSTKEWVRTTGGTCRALQRVQPQSLTLGSREATRRAWRSPLKYLARHWQSCWHITFYVVVGGLADAAPMVLPSCKMHAYDSQCTALISCNLLHGLPARPGAPPCGTEPQGHASPTALVCMCAWAAAQVPERIHKKTLTKVLTAGSAPPQSLRSLCLDLKDGSQPSSVSMIYGARSAASTSKAFAAVVECAVGHSAASLESLALFIPHLRSSLPAMASLQHLTLHQDSFCTFNNLHVSGLPRLQSLALLQADLAKSVQVVAPHLDLGCLHELQAVYLVSQLPEALTLPHGCALHVSGSCRRIIKLRNKPEWEQALAQIQSICEDYREGGDSLPVVSVKLWPQNCLSILTALSIVCPRSGAHL